MTSDALKTLFHPFEEGLLELPGGQVLFLGAEPGFRLPPGWGAALHAVQGFRPDYVALRNAGIDVSPRVERDGYDMALVLAGRHRGENEARLAKAILRVKASGLVVMAGEKTDGIGALRSRLDRNPDLLRDALRGQRPAGLVVETKDGRILSQTERLYHVLKTPVPLDGHLSKYHGLVFWLRRTPEAEAFASQTLDWQRNWPLIDGRFHTAPGMFSFDRIDAGSRLLAESLPTDLKGAVADFCAGWGYLSAEALARNPGISSLDLYEADYESLEAARKNVVADIPVGFFWHDLLAEPVARRYDVVLMNPPFHIGRAAEPAIGQGMIRAAAAALKPGGRLFLVANRQLPYERILAASFASAQEIASDRTFKVFAAKR